MSLLHEYIIIYHPISSYMMQQGICRRFVDHWHIGLRIWSMYNCSTIVVQCTYRRGVFVKLNQTTTNTETAVLSINKYYTPDVFEKYWAALSGVLEPSSPLSTLNFVPVFELDQTFVNIPIENTNTIWALQTLVSTRQLNNINITSQECQTVLTSQYIKLSFWSLSFFLGLFVF